MGFPTRPVICFISYVDNIRLINSSWDGRHPGSRLALVCNKLSGAKAHPVIAKDEKPLKNSNKP